MRLRKILSASALCAALALTGCAQSQTADSTTSANVTESTDTFAESTEYPADTSAESTTASSAQSSDSTSAHSTPTSESSQPQSVTSEQLEQSSAPESAEYREEECDEELYVNIASWSLYDAYEGAMWSDYYYINEKVHAVAKTNNGYYKLENGSYLPSSVLSEEPYGALPLPQSPPDDFKSKTSSYDPRKALEYAAERWYYGDSLCAEFGSQCLKAGGLPELYTTSATHLMNSLISSDLGFAVEIQRNEDGSVTLPDYAFPGDIVFFYCKTENLAMHTTIYNGDDENGHMKVYAHNDAADGQEPIYFYKHCVQGCKGTIDSVVMFCFYRNPEVLKQPDTAPELYYKAAGNGFSLYWEPDFLYGDATVVVENSLGEEILRKSTGTEGSYFLEMDSKEKLNAYVIFELGNDSVAKTAKASLSMDK